VEKLRRFSADSFLTHEASFRRRETCFAEADKRALFSADRHVQAAPRNASGDSIAPDDWMLREDLCGYLPDDVLTKVDRMSMANSLEVRVPILDHRIVEFACTVPFHLKYRRGISKRLVKRAFRGILPEAILAQRKRGFSIPIDRWFRGPLAAHFRDAVLGPESAASEFIDTTAAGRLFDAHVSGRVNRGHHLWTILMLEHWLNYRRASAVTRTPAGADVIEQTTRSVAPPRAACE
jgi:asparagine synthase (glutamine-hydrolysing)